jgi:hypothetical protein
MAKATQSIEYAAQVAAAANFTARIDDGRNIMGAVQFATILVELTADNVANDVINLIRLPDGARVLPQLSKVITTEDPNDGAFVVDIGDAADPDRYADGLDLAAVGLDDFLAPVTTVDGLLNPIDVKNTGVAATDTSLIQMKIITEAGVMAAADVYVILAYKCL